MSTRNENQKLIFFVLIITILLAGYILLVISKHEEEARRIGELLTIIVISVCTYYLGYSKRQREELSRNEKFRAKYSHITKKTIARFGYVFLGFGIALILQHTILFGVDLTFKELILGHEWIGLYITILSMIMLGMAKKIRDNNVTS